ncbi:hypothetical protein [Streptomyces sp. NPDC003480]
MTIAPDEIPLCAVARAAYNASGDVLTRHQRFLGNSFEVRDGSIHISGDIFENNIFVADKNVIVAPRCPWATTGASAMFM